MQSIKELNLKANHNPIALVVSGNKLYAIYQRTQSESKSQQGQMFNETMAKLYAIYQRTQSESKSQQLNRCSRFHPYCMQSIKELNLKANHNKEFKSDLLSD